MGLYRYSLAILVLLSHCGISFYGYNQGVIAVVSFFLISGYVITLLIKKHYNKKTDILYFYADRALRLFPQFILYLVITSLFLIYYGEMSIVKDSTRLIVNILMLPLNFFAVYNDSYIIVPQSWSLGLEMQFYILFPIIISFFSIKKWFIVSFIFFLVAYFNLINPDYYGYRMIAGTLFIFILGGYLTNPPKNKNKIIFIYILSVTFLLLSVVIRDVDNRIIEVLFGVVVGMPIVLFLARKDIRNKFDLLMGNLSYGVYLNHMFISLVLVKLGYDISKLSTLILLILLSTSLSYISFSLIEKPIYKFRHLIRRNHDSYDSPKNPRQKSFQ
ncbi:acyltransferase [Serratia fonticola]|uniref:acyltransferase family protein n=1 Tax=Serratia fonticola TaxID=47917 RepID=UPI001AE791A6|nr:acyltransferase [Serratia fonticola]